MNRWMATCEWNEWIVNYVFLKKLNFKLLNECLPHNSQYKGINYSFFSHN